ncbi:chromate efflux transporter [Nibricoccus sp. IMCC34717]|uniref:chromate efflux transporter n=1 Tax=Nibricoccus sp. IMCC34717 TaxID=3034021 RepID=UPI00384B3D6A
MAMDARIEVALAFLRQGLVSFGGPTAHIGYFREEFVVRRGWVTDADFADLVALCQFLPGPASSQVVFCLGKKRAGWTGAVVASLAFLLPSAVIMVALGCGAASVARTGWTHGLQLAAVAVVAHAVVGMARSLILDTKSVLLAVGVGVGAWLWTAPLAQVGLLAIAAGISVIGNTTGRESGPQPLRPPRATRTLWGVWLGLLVAAFGISSAAPGSAADFLGGIYRAGSLVFGGGHVVLPWLQGLAVPQWIDQATFMAGYGAAQALPGPLFAFAGYLGAAAGGMWLGVAATATVFLPAWLIVGGGLPWWERLRDWPAARTAMRGLNAAVVGLLASTWAQRLAPEAVVSLGSAAVAIVAFLLLLFWRIPPWLLVLGCAVAGSQ